MLCDGADETTLARAARRAASHGGVLVAGLIEAWQRGFPTGQAETELACGPGVVLELSLCLRPRASHWTTDVADIAETIQVDVARLEAFLRKAEIAERLSVANASAEVPDGRLMAARDRDEAPE